MNSLLGMKMSFNKGLQEDIILQIIAFQDYVMHGIPIMVDILNDMVKLSFNLNEEEYSLILSQAAELKKMLPEQFRLEIDNYVVFFKSIFHKSVVNYTDFFTVKPIKKFHIKQKTFNGTILVKIEEFSSGFKVTVHRVFLDKKIVLSIEIVIKKKVIL